MKFLIFISIIFLIYAVFKNRIDMQIDNMKKKKKSGENNFREIPIVSESSIDINSDLFIEVDIEKVHEYEENKEEIILGYKDFVRLSGDKRFHKIFITALSDSLNTKYNFYTNILNNTEPVYDMNHNDIASRLSCNNDIIRNVKEILSIIEDLKILIRSTDFDIEKRLKICIQLLDKIVGRDDLKNLISGDIIVFARSQKVFCSHFNNMVIYGPPGCGKSYCVGIIDKVYNLLGITLRPSKEITMEDLANAYANESSRQTRRTLLDGLERVLFFDEAYILGGNGNPFSGGSNGNEVITTIVQFLAEYEGKVNMIIAGYEKEMNIFLSKNDGFRRRFPEKRRANFLPYSSKELTGIFINRVAESDESIVFKNKSVSYLYTLINIHHHKLENGAGDITNMTREFVEFTYLRKSGSWRSGNYENNSKILSEFFNKCFPEIKL